MNLDFVRDVYDWIKALSLPHEIHVNYSDKSSFAGKLAGRYLLTSDRGSFKYLYHTDPSSNDVQGVLAENKVGHLFDNVLSVATWLKTNSFIGATKGDVASAFLRTKPYAPASLSVLVEKKPELGTVCCAIKRHPRYVSWLSRFSGSTVIDMTHEVFADLLLDNKEDLVEERLASYVSAFRSVKTVSYDADLGDANFEAVKVTYKAGSTGKGGDGDVKIPREFEADIPAYYGAWKAGDEPAHCARFRVRVLPPKNDDSGPLFRITWVNSTDYDLQANQALLDSIYSFLAVPVFLGTPSSVHSILP